MAGEKRKLWQHQARGGGGGGGAGDATNVLGKKGALRNALVPHLVAFEIVLEVWCTIQLWTEEKASKEGARGTHKKKCQSYGHNLGPVKQSTAPALAPAPTLTNQTEDTKQRTTGLMNAPMLNSGRKYGATAWKPSLSLKRCTRWIMPWWSMSRLSKSHAGAVSASSLGAAGMSRGIKAEEGNRRCSASNSANMRATNALWGELVCSR